LDCLQYGRDLADIVFLLEAFPAYLMELLMKLMIKRDTKKIRAFLTASIAATFHVMRIIAIPLHSRDAARQTGNIFTVFL
jgi:hypothetical protein